MKDYEQTYEEHWKDFCEKEGVPDMDAIKRELHDYWIVMGEVSKVYDHITGGKLSKPNTRAESVIDAAEESYAKCFAKP